MYRLIIVDDEPVNFYSIHHVVDWQLAYLLKPVKKEDIERVLPKLLDKLSQKSSVGIPNYDLNYSADSLSTPLKEYLTRAAVYPHNRVLLSDHPLT